MKDDANFYKVFGLSLNTNKKDNESNWNLNNNNIDYGKNTKRQIDDITITDSNSIIKVNNSSLDKRKEMNLVSNTNNDSNVYNSIHYKEYFNNAIKKSEYFNIILLQRPVYSDIQDFSNNRVINSINNSTTVKTNTNSKNSTNINSNSTINLKNEVINIEKTKRENYYYFIKHKLLDNSLECLKNDNNSKDINSRNNKHIKIDNLCLLDFHSLQVHYSSKSTITKEIYNLNFDNINFLSDMSLFGELSFLETICANCIYIPFNRKDISFNKENFTENSKILNPYGLNSKVNSLIEINSKNTDSKYNNNDSESTVNNLIFVSYETIFHWSEITEYNDSLVESTYKEISQKINNVINNLNSSNARNSNDNIVYSILLFNHFVFEEEDDWDKFLKGLDSNKKYSEYRSKGEESLRKALETKIHVLCKETDNKHCGEKKGLCYFCSFLAKLIDVYFYLYQIKDYYLSYNLILMNKVGSNKGRFNNNNNKILASVVSSSFNSFVDYTVSFFIKKHYDSKYDCVMCDCGVNEGKNNNEYTNSNSNSSNKRTNKDYFNLDFDNNDDILIKNTNSGSNNNRLDTRNNNINSNNDIIINSLKNILKYLDSLKFSYSEINRNENNPVIFFNSKFGINIINKNLNNTFNMELKNFLNREILYTTPSEYIELTIKNKDYSKSEFNINELQSINIISI